MVKYYDKYKKKPERHWKLYEMRGGYYSLVQDSITQFKETGSVIDVGCGDGVSSYILVSKGFNVLGIDNAVEGMETAVRKTVGLPFTGKVMRVEDYVNDYDDEFDYLYSLNTIEHLEDPTALIKLMRNIKRFGIIVTDNKKFRGGSKYHNIMFSRESLRELFKDFKTEEFHFSHDEAEKLFIGLKVYGYSKQRRG
ncbi:MAG TPA: class I SAM-dependent methyltransferase [bacterium]|nr:class I SAM-dependent methyltransferase [bacterium]